MERQRGKGEDEKGGWMARSVGRACPRVHRERSLTRRVLQGLGRVKAGEQARGEEVGGGLKERSRGRMKPVIFL